MRRRLGAWVLLMGVLAAAACVEVDEPARRLVWEEDFDGDALRDAYWNVQEGDGCDIGLCGWGNEELQWYHAQNAAVREGMLQIRVEQADVEGYRYTSARLHTAGKVDIRYGRVEARIRFPNGQGLWPAFWMMPTDSLYGGWAASGEIDIVEAVNGMETLHGTLHFGGEWPDNRMGTGTLDAATGASWADDFHVYAVEWEPERIRWYVDGRLYATQTEWSTTAAPYPAPFDQRFYLLLNVAVGGRFPGAPDASTAFPQAMYVDWIRVYEPAS